jgi:hypothetical protein
MREILLEKFRAATCSLSVPIHCCLYRCSRCVSVKGTVTLRPKKTGGLQQEAESLREVGNSRGGAAQITQAEACMPRSHPLPDALMSEQSPDAPSTSSHPGKSLYGGQRHKNLFNLCLIVGNCMWTRVW